MGVWPSPTISRPSQPRESPLPLQQRGPPPAPRVLSCPPTPGWVRDLAPHKQLLSTPPRFPPSPGVLVCPSPPPRSSVPSWKSVLWVVIAPLTPPSNSASPELNACPLHMTGELWPLAPVPGPGGTPLPQRRHTMPLAVVNGVFGDQAGLPTAQLVAAGTQAPEGVSRGWDWSGGVGGVAREGTGWKAAEG